MNRADFEARWHNKLVRKMAGRLQIPSGIYLVTAALLHFEDEISVFAVAGLSKGNFTLKLAPEELDLLYREFEVVLCEVCGVNRPCGWVSVGEFDDTSYELWVCQACHGAVKGERSS